MVSRLLIANRGEIAVRIVRAAQSRGIETVLAASAADRDGLAATIADRTVVIGPPPAKSSYLDAELLVHTAKATGCEAIHPGYGFLSERASFARLCEEEGLVFVGPTAESIECVGDKLGARALARATGVPMASGSGEIGSVEQALGIAEQIGYPVITKASAGGGGRGMTIARTPAELTAAFPRASLEATEAFGDGRLFLERFVERARHVEVQVLGDGKGRVVHFGERDCSVQRRHQKMIEEAPSEILPDTVRTRLHRAAIDLLAPIDYRGAGTVEFLYDEATQEFFFMEVNARLQVEHPVSEEIYGVNLVALQLDLAAGSPLPDQADLCPQGHAIEVRVLAEDPSRGFQPSPGRITAWHAPSGEGVRVDTAVGQNSIISPYYDSMIAKLIVRGRDRGHAIERLRAALADFQIEGIRTNLGLLQRIVADSEFEQNRITTRWLDQAVHRLLERKE